MRGSQCICNTHRALYRAIGSSGSACEAPRRSLLLHVPTTFSSTSARRRWPIATQLRSYANSPRPSRPSNQASAGNTASSSSSDPDDRGYDKRFTTQRDIDRSGRDRPPWDHEITDPQIMVIDNGVVEGPLATRYVLTKLESGESLRMIQPYVPADAKVPRAAQFAVCKIVNKRDEYERQKQLKEKKKTAAATKAKTKEMELTWAISGHDLTTKLRQMGGFLGKGMKVELTIGKKKGGRQVGADEAKDVLKKVREEMEIYGGREAKPANGQIGGTMRLYLEGVKTKSS